MTRYVESDRAVVAQLRLEQEFHSQPANHAEHDRIGKRELHHLAVTQFDQWRQAARQKEQKRGLSIGSCHRGNVRPHIDGNCDLLELIASDEPLIERLLRLGDVRPRDKDIVRNGRQATICPVEGLELAFTLKTQHQVNDGGEEVLIVNHTNDGEKHAQQSSEGECFLEGVADLPLLDHAIDGSEDDQKPQPDEADFRDMECQSTDEQDCSNALNDQPRVDGRGSRFALKAFGTLQNFTHGLRHFHTVAHNPLPLDEQASGEPTDEHWRRHRQHSHEELTEVPAHGFTDDEVLRLTDQCHDTAQCGANGGMHHEVPEKTPEVVEIQGGLLRKATIFLVIVISVVMTKAVGHTMEDRVETSSHSDDNSRHGESVKERRENSAHEAEGE